MKDRLGGLQASLRTRFAEVMSEMRLDGAWPDPGEQARRVRGQLESAVEQLDDQVVRACRADYRRPGRVAKLLVWLPLLWFPLVQPLAEGLLESAAAQGTPGTLHGLALVVRALGAASLLRGLVVVLLLYVFGLAAMYARSMRAVRQARQGTLADEPPPPGGDPTGRGTARLAAGGTAVPETATECGDAGAAGAGDEPDGAHIACLQRVLADKVFAPLAEPLEAAHTRLSEINAELEAIAAEQPKAG